MIILYLVSLIVGHAWLLQAINLANYIPSAQKDLVVLYNNSSAMYEKAAMYSDALIDASIVLSMDVKHIKARIRRGRVYEAMVSRHCVCVYVCI